MRKTDVKIDKFLETQKQFDERIKKLTDRWSNFVVPNIIPIGRMR